MTNPARPTDSTTTLAKDIAQGQAELALCEQELKELLHGVTREQAAWRPAEGKWSIVECVDHLAVTDECYIDKLRGPIEHGRTHNLLARGTPRYGWLSKLFVSMLEPPPRRRFPAPAVFKPAPAATLDLERACARLHAAHQKLAALGAQANGLDLVRVKIASPGSPLIKFPLGRIFQIIAAHERRHIWQARQVTHAPGYPTGSA